MKLYMKHIEFARDNRRCPVQNRCSEQEVECDRDGYDYINCCVYQRIIHNRREK